MLSKSPLIPSLISTYKTLISDEIEVNDQVQEHPVPIFLYFNALCRLLTYFQNLHTGKVAHIQGWTPVWFLLWGFYILLTPSMPFIMAGHYSQKGLQRKNIVCTLLLNITKPISYNDKLKQAISNNKCTHVWVIRFFVLWP